MGIDILFYGKGLVILAKPAGLVSSTPPGSEKLPQPEVEEFLKHHRMGWLCHRIDRFTSGLLMAARDQNLRQHLITNWHEVTKKTYLAVIRRPLPGWKTMTVDSPIDGKPATTTFTRIEKVGEFVLVQCELINSGRTHQIRRHLREIGCPIVGDRVYGGQTADFRRGQLLHAWKLEVQTPDGVWNKFQAYIPGDFRSFAPFSWGKWNKGATNRIKVLSMPGNWKRPTPHPKS